MDLKKTGKIVKYFSSVSAHDTEEQKKVKKNREMARVIQLTLPFPLTVQKNKDK